MKFRLFPLMTSIALCFAANPVAAEQPSIGDIFDIDPGEVFRDWKLNLSGISETKQSYAIFERNGIFLIAATKPVVGTATGGFAVEKIFLTKIVTIPQEENLIYGFDCGFLGNSPAISLFNPKTKVATGYFVLSDEIALRRWIVDEPSLCAYSGD